MYTYKRFKTSRLAVIIILIALALVAWELLGPTGAPLAGKMVPATFELKYTTGLGFDAVDGTVTVSFDVSPGARAISVSNVPLVDYGGDTLTLGECSYKASTGGRPPNPYWRIIEENKTPGTVRVAFWFTNEDDGVDYVLGMRGGEIVGGGDLLPANIGDTTTVTSSGNWKLSVAKGKDKDALVGCDTWGPMNWTLTIKRAS